MRGTRAKRERRLGLRSGPTPRDWVYRKLNIGWHRTTALIPNPVVESAAEAKRKRRRERNLRVLGLA